MGHPDTATEAVGLQATSDRNPSFSVRLAISNPDTPNSSPKRSSKNEKTQRTVEAWLASNPFPTKNLILSPKSNPSPVTPLAPPLDPVSQSGCLWVLDLHGTPRPVRLRMEACSVRGFEWMYPAGRWKLTRDTFSCTAAVSLSADAEGPVPTRAGIWISGRDRSVFRPVAGFAVGVSAETAAGEVPVDVAVVRAGKFAEVGPEPVRMWSGAGARRSGGEASLSSGHCFESLDILDPEAALRARRGRKSRYRIVFELWADVGDEVEPKYVMIAQRKSCSLFVPYRPPRRFHPGVFEAWVSELEVRDGLQLVGLIDRIESLRVTEERSERRRVARRKTPKKMAAATTTSVGYSTDTGQSEDVVSTDYTEGDDHGWEKRRQEVIDRVMKSFCSWLDRKIASLPQADGECGGSTAPGSGFRQPTPSKSQQSAGTSEHPKRKRNSDDEGEDSGRGGGRRAHDRKSTPSEGGDSVRYACPYFKRDPARYGKERTCPGPGWTEIHRIKEHLRRRHARPPQCPRCWETFHSPDDRDFHLQRNPPCETRPNQIPHEGLSKAQEDQLRKRQKSEMSNTEKWREIYRILFPDDHPTMIPSPFYEPADFESSGRMHFTTFARREFPRLVRHELERLFQTEFRDVEDRLRPRVEEIVLQLQPTIFNHYQQSQQAAQASRVGGEEDRESVFTSDTTVPTESEVPTEALSLGHAVGLPGSGEDVMAGLAKVEDHGGQGLGPLGDFGIDWDEHMRGFSWGASEGGIYWDADFGLSGNGQ